MRQKKLFFIRSEVFGLLVKTLTANCEYSRSNGENFPLPIQIKLSKISYTFWAIFLMHFWFLHENSNVLKKNNELQRSSIPEVLDSERCAYLIASQGFFLKTLWQ